MRIKAVVYAAFALALLARPGPARAMGLGNTAPIVDSVTVSPTPARENDAATITCVAHDGSSVASLTVTVSGGLLAGGGTSEALAITPGASVSGTVAWTTPAAGSHTVTCQATDDLGALSAVSSIPVDVVVAGPPPAVALSAGAASVYPGETVQLTGSASSPDGSPLQLDWLATGGTLAPSGETATWTAPSQAGSYTVTLAATNANGQATASATIEVVWARADGSYAAQAPGFVPERVALDAAGTTYVANSASRSVEVYTAVGAKLRTLRTRGRPSGVAASAEGVWVTDLENRAVYLLGIADGKPVRSLGTGDGEFDRPLDVAVNAASGRVYVADAGARRLRLQVEGGGRKLIQMVDDGCGMLRDDAMLEVVRDLTLQKQAEAERDQRFASFAGKALLFIRREHVQIFA